MPNDMVRYCRQNKNIIESQIDNEKILFQTESGKTYALSPVGSVIWDFLQNGAQDIDAICAHLQTQFEVSAEQCYHETIAFIEQLKGNQLVLGV